jgi:hypothetical protein
LRYIVVVLSALTSGDFGNQNHNTVQMTDLEAQRAASALHNDNGPAVDPGPSTGPAVPPSPPSRPATSQDSHPGSEGDDDDDPDFDEEAGLYNLAEELRSRDPPVEPWFLEMTRLRRIYILWLNKQLALSRKSILGSQRASDKDMERLGELLHLQGKLNDVRSQPSLH